jgi:hypothetical protein
MSDTLLRQLEMLRLIPRLPRKIVTSTLKSRLADSGYDIDLRTIQRDLLKLSDILPLVADNAKPQGWSWQATAPAQDFPALDQQTALTFRLVESYMQHLLPISTLNYLNPWFRAAHGVLEKQGNGLAHWPEKIRVLPRGLSQKTPVIDHEVEDAVYQAVLQERQLEITYSKYEDQELKSYVVHPLALVVRDRVIYLVCVFEGYSDPRQLALHRMKTAVIREEPLTRPKGFSIDVYINEGEFGIVVDPHPILLKAKFSQHVAIHLRESPISDDQVIKDVDDENVMLRATVSNTLELRLWLKSFGDEVEVISPADLRQEFRKMVDSLKIRYGDTG